MMTYREVSLADVDAIVRIHKKAFESFFLTQLGDSFLELYYSAFIKENSSIVIGAYVNNELYGFAATAINSKGFNSKLVKSNLIAFMRVGFRLLFTHPKAIYRLLKNFSKTGNSDDKTYDYAEIMSICVDPNFQGQAIGVSLIKQIEQNIFVNNRSNSISLTTDYYNNDKVVSFYNYLGYYELYTFMTYPERKMYRLIKYKEAL